MEEEETHHRARAPLNVHFRAHTINFTDLIKKRTLAHVLYGHTLQRTWLHCFIPLAFIKRLLCAGLCRLMAFRGYCCWRGLWEAELLPAALCPCVRRKQPLQVDPALQICWHQKEVPPRPGRGSSNLGHVVFLSRSEPPLVSLAGHTCAVNNLYKSSRQPCQEVTIQYFCYLARRPTLPWQLVWTANHYLIHPCEAPWSNVQATL